MTLLRLWQRLILGISLDKLILFGLNNPAIAQKLYQDPQWQEMILEAPEVLGVENISHSGILIRLLIKTQPLQQWQVGRELRRCLKKAFDDQGIEIGIPQQIEMPITN